MITKSENANPNYLAKIIKLHGLVKHPKADRLQIATVDFQQVITGESSKNGDICVFFPLECQINQEYLSGTNEFRDKTMNIDPEKAGFFEKKGRVRAVKLRGEKSMGYIVPVATLEEFYGVTLADKVGEEFDTIKDVLLCKKYMPPQRPMYVREGQKPRISRLVDNQVRLHVDTENLRRNADKISPEDFINVSYKTHGTSFWVANVLVKKHLSLVQRIARFFGVPVQDTEYDHVYGSRKVVKNEYETREAMHYYGTDIWGDIKNEIADMVPKGYTVYGEALGYTEGGGYIQEQYDYGCKPGERKLQIYRITITNPDGLVVDLSSPQVKEFCDRVGLTMVHQFYTGRAKDLYDIPTDTHWNEEFVKRLEAEYNEKDCFICANPVPEEGIVVRNEKLFSFDAFKLKSFRFLEHETALLDKEVVDLESTN